MPIRSLVFTKSFYIPESILIRIELSLSVIYLLEFIYNYAVSSNKTNFLLTYLSLLDILNTLPGFLNLIYTSNRIVLVISFLKSWRIFGILLFSFN